VNSANPLAAPPTDQFVHDVDGWLYRQELVDCGRGATGRCRKCTAGPAHGPYWYRYKWQTGGLHKRYVGKHLPESLVAALGAHADPRPNG
jgi:hypothetical protein